MINKLSIIVPVYNEEKNIPEFLNRLLATLKKINIDYEIIFLLDPSTDNTEELIINETKKNNKIKLIVFSRRFGQPSATMAGIILVAKDV
jgi:dolichol-phosphate mannosyltransferase